MHGLNQTQPRRTRLIMFSLTSIRQELKGAEVYGTANPYADVQKKKTDGQTQYLS
jgi:hypothetical protein